MSLSWRLRTVVQAAERGEKHFSEAKALFISLVLMPEASGLKSRAIKCRPIMYSSLSATFLAGLMTAVVVAGMPGKIGAQEVEAQKTMRADAHPAFEVASIKLADPDEKRDGFDVKGRHVLMENIPVMTMLVFGYGVSPKQVAGVPDWAKSEHWDVDGVPDVEGAPNLAQMQGMVQGLLTDRFGLKVHHETREVAGYALTVAKGGPKIAKSQGDPNGLPRQNSHMNAGQRDIKFTNNTMREFALAMSST